MYENEQYNLFRSSSNSWIFRGLILLSLSLTTYFKWLTVYRLCIYCIPLNIVFLLKGKNKSGGNLGGGGDSHLIPYQGHQKCSCLKASNRVATVAASPFSTEPCAVFWCSCDGTGGRINSFFLPDVPEQFSDCVNKKPTPDARSKPQGQTSLSSTLCSRTKLCLVSRPAQWGRVSVVIVCVLKAPHSVEPRPQWQKRCTKRVGPSPPHPCFLAFIIFCFSSYNQCSAYLLSPSTVKGYYEVKSLGDRSTMGDVLNCRVIQLR